MRHLEWFPRDGDGNNNTSNRTAQTKKKSRLNRFHQRIDDGVQVLRRHIFLNHCDVLDCYELDGEWDVKRLDACPESTVEQSAGNRDGYAPEMIVSKREYSQRRTISQVHGTYAPSAPPKPVTPLAMA